MVSVDNNGFTANRLVQSILLVSLSLFFVSVQASAVVRLTSGEWPPYLSERLPYGGFAAHVVTEAFFEVGIDVEISHYPWKRSYKYALDGVDQNGKIWHGTMVWVDTPERRKHFYYSDAVVIDDEVLFHLKKYPLNWLSVSDLEGKVLGGTAHTAYPALEEAESKGVIKIVRGGNYDALLKRVFHQKIDAAPLVKQVAFYYLQDTFSKTEQMKFTFSPTIVETRYYHLILSKADRSNEALIERFNQGLQKLHASGRYQELIRKLRRGYYTNQIKEQEQVSPTPEH